MPTNEKDPSIITLPEVRLSFPSIWTPTSMEEGQEQQFEATFLLNNTTHAALLDHIDALIDRMALDKWKKKVTFVRCLRDGNERSSTDGYGDGVSFLCARNKVRPGVVDRRLTPIAESDGIIYAGCYVNAVIRLFPWEYKTVKKGISAQLSAIQFVKDGPSFGAGPVDPTKVFTSLEDSDDKSGAPVGSNTRSRSSGKPSSNLEDY